MSLWKSKWKLYYFSEWIIAENIIVQGKHFVLINTVCKFVFGVTYLLWRVIQLVPLTPDRCVSLCMANFQLYIHVHYINQSDFQWSFSSSVDLHSFLRLGWDFIFLSLGLREYVLISDISSFLRIVDQ